MLPELEELAQAYGRARAPFIILGNGLSRYGNGAMNVRAIVCLPALVGAYARKGGGCFTGVANGGGFALGEVTREDFLPGPVRTVNMNRLGHALEVLDGPRIMGLYVYHSNPAAVAPDQNAVLRGLARLVDAGWVTSYERWCQTGVLAAPPHALQEATRCAEVVLAKFFPSIPAS